MRKNAQPERGLGDWLPGAGEIFRVSRACPRTRGYRSVLSRRGPLGLLENLLTSYDPDRLAALLWGPGGVRSPEPEIWVAVPAGTKYVLERGRLGTTLWLSPWLSRADRQRALVAALADYLDPGGARETEGASRSARSG